MKILFRLFSWWVLLFFAVFGNKGDDDDKCYDFVEIGRYEG